MVTSLEEKICKLCGKPFETYVELGPEKYPVWMHDYPTLKHCKATRWNTDFIKLLEQKEAGMQKIWERYYEQFGKPREEGSVGTA